MSESLLIIRPGAIGDTLLTFPILLALKERKQAHITFVSNPAVLPLASTFGLADAVFDYGALAWSELFSPSGIRSSFLLDMLRQTDSVICWLRDGDGIVEHNLRKAGITQLLIAPSRPDETSDVHIVDYLAGTLGMTLTNDEVMQTLKRTDDEVIKRIDDESMQPLKRVDDESMQPLKPGHPQGDAPPIRRVDGGIFVYGRGIPLRVPWSQTSRTITIHPGSGSAAKCWPIERFASVITTLWQQHIPVLLLAGPADTERLAKLLTLLEIPPTPSVLEIITDAPLLEVATRLKHCSAYLGNDSGITHLAAMLGVPTLALFGPSNPNVWRPVGLDVRVLYNSNLGDITVENVLNILAMTIDRNNIE